MFESSLKNDFFIQFLTKQWKLQKTTVPSHAAAKSVLAGAFLSRSPASQDCLRAERSRAGG